MIKNKINQKQNILNYKYFHISKFTNSTFIKHIINYLLNKIKSLQQSFIITIFNKIITPYLLNNTTI